MFPRACLSPLLRNFMPDPPCEALSDPKFSCSNLWSFIGVLSGVCFRSCLHIGLLGFKLLSAVVDLCLVLVFRPSRMISGATYRALRSGLRFLSPAQYCGVICVPAETRVGRPISIGLQTCAEAATSLGWADAGDTCVGTWHRVTCGLLVYC